MWNLFICFNFSIYDFASKVQKMKKKTRKIEKSGTSMSKSLKNLYTFGHIKHNKHIPVGYVSGLVRNGHFRKAHTITHSLRTTYARQSPIHVLMHLIVASLQQVKFLGITMPTLNI